MDDVQIPHAIQLQDPITKKGGEIVTFQKYAHDPWLNDPRWESPKVNLARLMVVLPLLGNSAGEWIELEDQDWVILSRSSTFRATGPRSANVLRPARSDPAWTYLRKGRPGSSHQATAGRCERRSRATRH